MKNARMRKKTKPSKLETAYTDEFKAELDHRYAGYKNGTATIITAEESNRRIEQILKAHRSK